MIVNDLLQARSKGIQVGVRLDLGRIRYQLAAPHETCLLAEIDDVLEEPTEDLQPQALSNLDEAGTIGERFIEVVAKVPAMSEVELRLFHGLAFGTDALEEHHQLELEEDRRIDGGTTTGCIAISDPLTDEGEVEGGIEMAVEVISGNEPFEGDQDGAIQVALFGRTEHGAGATF